MGKEREAVIAGDYEGNCVSCIFGEVKILLNFKESIILNKDTVESYELITDEHRKSAASGVARGLVGGALLGPVGMIVGGMSAKDKGIYHIAIQFKDGKKSLIRVKDKIYKAIMKNCF